MASLNKVLLMGQLTRDPELKYTPKGTAIADLGIAINRNYTTDSGEKCEEVTFADVTFWGKTAEIIAKHFTKGRSIFVEGRLTLDQWDDKTTGQKRSKLKITGDSFEFLPDGKGAGAPGEKRDNPVAEHKFSQQPEDTSEIPF